MKFKKPNQDLSDRPYLYIYKHTHTYLYIYVHIDSGTVYTCLQNKDISKNMGDLDEKCTF